MGFPNSLIKFLFYFIRQQWIAFSVIFAISFFWALTEALFPYFIKQIVNTLQQYQGNYENVYTAISGTFVLLILLWLSMNLLQRFQGVLQIFTFPVFRARIRETIFNYAKLHSHEYFSNHFAGNLAKKLVDLPNSCQNILEIISTQIFTALAGTLIVFFMIWGINPIFSLILGIWLIIHTIILSVALVYGNHLWVSHSDSVSALTGKIVDVFSNIFTVRIFARVKFETEYIKPYQLDEIKKARKAMLFNELTLLLLGVAGSFLIFAMIFALIYGWTKHWVTLGDFTQISMQSLWVLGWVWHISYQMSILSKETGIVKDALNIVNKRHDIVDQLDAKPINIKKGEIVFDNVEFGYSSKIKVFSRFNLSIPSGQKVGLVGFSGSGKSTFINLILRLYNLQAGRILIDQQDIVTVKQESLRSQVAVIPQDAMLFHRSLVENIRYGRLDATDEEVIQASKLAHCHEFIELLDDKYNTTVGERGIKLSGGQRQRIAIARAILKNAPILILDEATASLDSASEKLIQEGLDRLMKDKTTIVIAHRLSTLANMDKIIVFDKGKIIEQGNNEELRNSGGHFAKLWEMQRDGFLPLNE